MDLEKIPQVDPSRFPYRSTDRAQIEEHAEGFRVGDRCVYSGVLPIGPEVVVIGWDREMFNLAKEAGKCGGDLEYRFGLVPVIEEGCEYFQSYWVAPHQLKLMEVEG